MKTAGVLLAGGRSRRFGSEKAFALHDGKPFYCYSLEALQPFCGEIAIVARPELAKGFPDDCLVIEDMKEYAGMGPLAGILSAMEAVQADRYIVLPCDMPFIRPETIGNLLVLHKGAVSAVTVEGKRHPLVSIWQADVKQSIRRALDSGSRRVMHVQSAHEGCWIEGDLLTEEPLVQFKNVNTPCELERR